MRYLLIVALALAAMGLGWFFVVGSASSNSNAVEIGLGDSAPAQDAAAVELDAVQPSLELDRTAAAPVAVTAPAAVTSSAAGDGDHPFAGAFAGVTGRVVEADGASVPGLTVTLMQISAES